MLKKIRVAVASFFLIAVTLLFLDFTGTIHKYLGWTAKAQFVPAALAVNVVAVATLLLVTIIFGRIYCSMICPLGIIQDKISRIAGFGKKNRFSYRLPRKAFVITRYALLVVFVITLIVGTASIPSLLDPYSAYGRMVSQIAGPLYMYGNNVLATFAEKFDSYAFYPVEVWIKSVSALVIAAFTLLTISVFAVKSGRGYCNAVCPVGALLGIISNRAIIKTRIIKDKCANCGLCAKNCKAGCIDPSRLEIDHYRCIACFNCINVCPKRTVVYDAAKPKKNSASDNPMISDNLTADGLARRSLMTGTAMLAVGAATGVIARTYEFDGGLAPIEDKKEPERGRRIIPPGAQNVRRFRKHCTGCQLCVTACSNQVLRPSSKISEFMQPHMSFERGYCRPECVNCSNVCPTGAILPITPAEKSSTQIGRAVWVGERCIVKIDNVPCDLCERKCPTAAIRLIPQNANDHELPKIPMIDDTRCIGCGACEHLCPSRPLSAIYVEGIDTHRTI